MKAALIQLQAEENSRRAVELTVKRVEMEIKRTEMELQHRLDLTKLEAESEVAAAKNQEELAKLEAFLTEQEVSDLPSCEEGAKWPHKHDMNFKGIEIQPPEVPSVTLPSVTTTSSNLDIGPRANPPLTSTPATENPLTTSSTPPIAKIRFRVPHVTSKELTEPDVNVQSEKVPSPNIPKLQQLTPLDPVLQPATYTRPAPSSVMGSVSNEGLVPIMSSMERMSVSHDLPPVQVQKFDGSPERYPAFRQRFKQLVETRPLDDSVKMTRLLQFLEGPALLAVQRYVPMPRGLSKALKK